MGVQPSQMKAGLCIACPQGQKIGSDLFACINVAHNPRGEERIVRICNENQKEARERIKASTFRGTRNL